MTRFHSLFRYFSTRLLLGFFSLILFSAVGAGAPAYWLTRGELERQAWDTVQNARQATHSLLEAEQARLLNLATLLAERPTLQRLLLQDDQAQLVRYLNDFQQQSQLDRLLICDRNGRVYTSQGRQTDCPLLAGTALIGHDQPPVWWSSHPVRSPQSDEVLAKALVGIVLDDRFWQQMSSKTSVAYRLFTTEGRPLAGTNAPTERDETSSLDNETAEITIDQTSDQTGRYPIERQGRQFYAVLLPLGEKTTSPLRLEVALPVDQLLANSRRAWLLFIASTGLSAVLGVLLAGWYVRRLTQPLSQLTGAAEHIGQGDLLATIPAFVAPHEVATLSTALIKSQATMLQALEERSDFLATVSHEFQTPLSTLQAALELVTAEEEDLSAAEMRQVLTPGLISLLSLKNLIDNLLQSGSVEAGRLVMHKRLIHLGGVIDEAQRLVQPLLDRRQQPLLLPRSLPALPLQVDPARLTQVLVNLLGNASKYSPVGSPIELTVDRLPAGEGLPTTLRVRVADRGPGIPPADRSQLFRRFVRIAQQTGEQAGVGLGLHVVKTTVERHGGVVGIDDHLGGGSIFWFTLPLITEEDV